MCISFRYNIIISALITTHVWNNFFRRVIRMEKLKFNFYYDASRFFVIFAFTSFPFFSLTYHFFLFFLSYPS